MRIVRLAQIFELKYSLKSEAASIQDIMNDVKREIINAYQLYIDPKTAKKASLSFFAQEGEPHAAKIIAYMTALTAKINELSAHPALLFKAVNKVLENTEALHTAMKNDKWILERLPRESLRNQLNHEKRTLGTVLQNLTYILVKQAKILRKFADPEAELSGGEIIPERKPLSKDKLRMYGAALFGTDNLDVMEQLLLDPEMTSRLTTLINSIERGHLSANDPKVMQEAHRIREWLKNREKTNLPALEQLPEQPGPSTLFEEEGEK